MSQTPDPHDSETAPDGEPNDAGEGAPEYDVEFSAIGHDEAAAELAREAEAANEEPAGPPILAKRYELSYILGRGAMGEVWRARDLQQGDDVAVKIVKAELGAQEYVERFWREARVLTRIRHPNVLEFRDYGADPKPFLVMEMLKGEDLSKIIARWRRLPLARAAGIFRQACAGLAYVHNAGVIHRDLKPANIFCQESGPVKIVDFGLAKRQHALAGGVDGDSSDGSTRELFTTRAGTLVGTLKYMSPEQLSRKEVDFRTDLWSMAIVLYKMLTGKNAFDADTEVDIMLAILQEPTPVPSKVVRDMPPKIDSFFQRALQKKPQNRFASAIDMGNALSSIVGLPMIDT